METNLKNLFCELHQKRQIIFIDLSQNPNNENRLFCSKCLQLRLDTNLSDSPLVEVEEIISCENNSDILNWPAIENEEVRQLQEKLKKINFEYEKNQVIQKFSQEIDEYLEKIIDKIQKIKEQTISHIQQFFAQKELSQKNYFEEHNFEIFDKAYFLDKIRFCFDNESINEQINNYTTQLNDLEKNAENSLQKCKEQEPNIFKQIFNVFFKKVNQIPYLLKSSFDENYIGKYEDDFRFIKNKEVVFFKNQNQDQYKIKSGIYDADQKVKFKIEFVCLGEFGFNSDFFSFNLFYNSNESNFQRNYILFGSENQTLPIGFDYKMKDPQKVFGNIYKDNGKKVILYLEYDHGKKCRIYDEDQNFVMECTKKFEDRFQWYFSIHWSKQRQYQFHISQIE